MAQKKFFVITIVTIIIIIIIIIIVRIIIIYIWYGPSDNMMHIFIAIFFEAVAASCIYETKDSVEFIIKKCFLTKEEKMGKEKLAFW